MVPRLGPALIALAIAMIALINGVRTTGVLRLAHVVVGIAAVAGAIWWVRRVRTDR